MNPPPAEYRKRPQDGISRGQKPVAAESIFRVPPGIQGYLGIYGAEIRVGGAIGGPQAWAPLWRASRAFHGLVVLLSSSRSFLGVLLSNKNRQKVSFRLDSIWY